MSMLVATGVIGLSMAPALLSHGRYRCSGVRWRSLFQYYIIEIGLGEVTVEDLANITDVILAHSSTKLRLKLQKSSTKFLFPKTANQRILKLFLAEIKSNFD